ncbi:hypothetical protein C8P68_105289 [Mucilaginibacter yixingensis]|uniref:Lipoprotein n=1 Tax=Mucilaginibacter yixingensis TaxID=1295612 RepID=A0A2T5J8Q5_9SPHI|nr:hypothetical protein C8P68_105289 [Mucilaginibacter yixingensis]
MRKSFIIFILFLTACSSNFPEQMKAESLVKIKLHSFNNSNNYKIISFKSFHPNYTTFEDDINYNKYKTIPSKLDSIKRNYKPFIAGWVMYVRFSGYDEHGKFGTHTYQCAFNSKLSKIVVSIEVDGMSI